MKVLLLGLFHETHCFVPGLTGLADFDIERGADILARRGDGSQVDGFLEIADREGWEIVPVCSYTATPSGTVADAVLDAFFADARPGVQQAADQGVDAVFLSLHGAMVTQSHDDVEGALLRWLRGVPGLADKPVFGVFDLHANLTQDMTDLATGLVCYRENPHVDARDSAVRAADLLARTLTTGERPRMIRRKVPIVWPPPGTGTADTPMRDLEALARGLESEQPELWAVNVVAGFSFADVPDAGVCFSVVTTGNEATAIAALDRLAKRAFVLRAKGLVREAMPEEAIDRLASMPGSGPVLLVESSDNIGAGAPGNGTHLLRALIGHGVGNAAITIDDPDAVARLSAHTPGDRVTIALGGKDNPFDAGPVDLEVELLSLSDGRFELEDIHSHMAASRGRHIDMGPTAVVRHQGITVLITSLRTPPNDLGQWRSQGFDPESFDVIVIKAAVAHRRAYDPIARGSITVATPGPCSSDPNTLPYTKLRRPVFPLDEIDTP